MVLTFPRGYDWLTAENYIRKRRFPCNSMALCYWILAKDCSKIIALNHNQAPQIAANRGWEYHEIETHHPMWLYARHKHNGSSGNYDMETAKQFSIEASNQTLTQFGIDLRKYPLYHQKQRKFPAVKPESQWRQNQKFEINRQASQLLQRQKTLSPGDPQQSQIQRQLETLKSQLYAAGKNCF